jgi:hypothetical protein
MENKMSSLPKIIHPEADYLELERLGTKLGIPVPSVRITIEATKDGKVTGRYHARSHTWNRNYWNSILNLITGNNWVATNFGTGYLSVKATDTVVAAITGGPVYFTNRAPVSNATYGIIFGRGVGAESFEGYVLTTPIAEGVAANCFNYAAMAAITQEWTVGTLTWKITIKRLANNNSGNTITVSEVSLGYYNSPTTRVYTFSRDLLAATVDVLNNGQVTGTYEISLTFPQ